MLFHSDLTAQGHGKILSCSSGPPFLFTIPNVKTNIPDRYYWNNQTNRGYFDRSLTKDDCVCCFQRFENSSKLSPPCESCSNFFVASGKTHQKLEMETDEKENFESFVSEESEVSADYFKTGEAKAILKTPASTPEEKETVKDKRVTFGSNHHHQIEETSESDQEHFYEVPAADLRDVTSQSDELNPELLANNEALFVNKSHHYVPESNNNISRASSDPNLDKASDSNRTDNYSDLRRTKSNKTSKTSTSLDLDFSLHRSSSDKVLSTLSPSTLSSLEFSRKDKKRRSVIKKRILKIQKAFKKKPKPNSLEESEGTGGEYLPGSDDSDDVSNKSEGRETNGLLNGEGEYTNGNGESSVHGLELTSASRYPRPQHLKTLPHSYSKPASRAESRNSSSNYRSSCSSIDLDSPGFHSEGSKPRLKTTSTSPAALNSIATTEGELSEDTSLSPRLTPTHSNFDDKQLIGPSMGVAYHPHNNSLQIQNDSMIRTSSISKQGSMRKKKRSGSWYNVLSPSYKQKNEAFHKFFKDLPSSERLLVDYTCAMVKDILVQGRLYVSQNYLCFHSNILKWQTAVTVKLVDIDQMTKEKTVKVIPNAIQILMKDKTKITFTSFTARDRAYLTTFRLWQNALLDKPMTAHELWTQIHSNYGEELGLCSSDDDYVRPDNMPRKHQSFGEGDSDMKYEFGTTNKVKRKKKLTNSTQTPPDGELEKLNRRDSKSNKSSSSARHSSQDSCHQFQQGSDSDDKSIHSSQCSREDISLADDVIQDEDDDEEDFSVDVSRSRKNSSRIEEQVVEEEENDEPADFTLPDCHKVSLFCIYETSAKDMFRIIFGEENECSFWKDTLVNKGTTQIEFGRWGDDEEVKGQKIRHLAYTLRLDNPIGPKTSHCKEKQILYASTVEGKSYGIDCIVQNYGIPYADYFYTCMRYCIRKVTKNKCEVRVTSELRYKKTPWGLVKNFIEKNVASGLTQNFTKLTWQLRNQVENEKSQPQIEDNKSRQNGNVRRRKRRSETGKDGLKSKGSRSSSSLSNENQRGQSSQKDRNDLNNNKGSLTPSGDATPGVPSMRMPNGYIPSSRPYDTESPKLHYFGQGGKFIIGAILFIFVLLIYSNYSMYQRLTTLEQVTAAAATADGVDPSVTAALLDRPGVPISSNPEMMSTYLRAIDKRLQRLEDSMVKFAETSGAKWEKMEKDWASLQKMLQTILQHKMTNGA